MNETVAIPDELRAFWAQQDASLAFVFGPTTEAPPSDMERLIDDAMLLHTLNALHPPLCFKCSTKLLPERRNSVR